MKSKLLFPIFLPFSVLLLLFLIAGCGGGSSGSSGATSSDPAPPPAPPAPSDTIPPTVSITSPSSGSSLSGTTSLTATASDNVGVASVQFQIDGSNVGSVITTAPYTYAWDTTQTSNASHTLTAIAKDGAGNSAESASVSVTVSNISPAETFDGSAELPRLQVDTAMPDTSSYTVVNVSSGGNLQSAINNASCGTVIKLQAGGTWTGHYTLPAKNCDATHWIILRTETPDNQLPPVGTPPSRPMR